MHTFILDVHLDRNRPFLHDLQSEYQEPYTLVEVEISAESFLYKMIRKLVGAAVDVAQGRIPHEQILEMMADPPSFYYSNLTTVLHPDGLFLKSVNYNPNYNQTP